MYNGKAFLSRGMTAHVFQERRNGRNMGCLRIQDKDIYMWRYVYVEIYAFLNCQANRRYNHNLDSYTCTVSLRPHVLQSIFQSLYLHAPVNFHPGPVF